MEPSPDSRLSIEVCWKPGEEIARMADEVRLGLTAQPKWLPSKYFYDARGSELFDEITRLPEYYPTRTEDRILRPLGNTLIEELAIQELVEIGSGLSTKTLMLLDAMERLGSLGRYVPIDISRQTLEESARSLLQRYPNLLVHGIVGDFSEHLDRVPPRIGRRLVIFLGSTIGNLDERERLHFLQTVRKLLVPGDHFLVGLDLVKDIAQLEAAYNDKAGVTAEFNKNVLRVINRGLEADFDVDAFQHRAFYNVSQARIEMHLAPTREQAVSLRRVPLVAQISTSETIRTEISCKFTRETVAAMLEGAGLRLERWYTDPESLFGLALAGPADEG